MRILIGYDGSECADAALHDLKRAGLPLEAEVLVVSVADVLHPRESSEEVKNSFPLYEGSGRWKEHAAQALRHARLMAERACDRLQSLFPYWEIGLDVPADSPAWAIIDRANEWRPDMVVVGSHGDSSWGGRWILGSVSQRVLAEARTTVRVARGSAGAADAPVRIVLGTDGSPGAAAALDAVNARIWPGGSEVKIVAVLNTILFVTPDPTQPTIVKWVEVSDEAQREWARKFFEVQADKLRATGLSTTVELRKGNPKKVLIEEATEWKADSIFVGAQGIRGLDRLLIGSVSATVAARAPCSVEVVRSRSGAGGSHATN